MTVALRRVMFVACALAAALGAMCSSLPIASAQQSGWDKTYDQCKSRTEDEAIVNQLVKDHAVSEDDLRKDMGATTAYNQGDVQKVLARPELKERIQQIRDQHQNDQGVWSRLGRTFNSFECTLSQPFEAVANEGFWGDPIGKFTKSVLEGNAQTMATMMTLWMGFSTTSVDVAGNAQGVKNIVMGLSGFALVASFIIGGWRIVSSRRGGLQEGMDDLNENMLRWLVFSLAVPVMFPGAMVASDKLADAIMNQFGVQSDEQLVNLGSLQDTPFGPIFALVLAAIMLIGSFVQILALVARVLLAPIAVGLAPLLAALSFSDTGRQGLNHLVAWLIAAIVFKPVSALLYAVVLWNVTRGGDIGLAGGVVNALMLGIAGFSAPLLVRALVPAVSQAGGGGAAPMLAGATGAVAGTVSAAGVMASTAGSVVAGKGVSAAGTGAQSIAGGGASAAGSGVVGGSRKTASATSGSSGGAAGPSGAMGSSRRASVGSAVRGGVTATRRSVGGALVGAGSAAGRAGQSLDRVGGRVGHGSQRLFDDSIGVPGHYAGQVHR